MVRPWPERTSQLRRQRRYHPAYLRHRSINIQLSMQLVRLPSILPNVVDRQVANPTQTRRAMPHFLDFAPEVLHGVFKQVDPTDLAVLSQCCRFLNSFIKNDVLLWKIHYLKRFVCSTLLLLTSHRLTLIAGLSYLGQSTRERLLEYKASRKYRPTETPRVPRCRCQGDGHRPHAILILKPSQQNSLVKVASGALDLIAESPIGSLPSRNIAFLSRLFSLPRNSSSFLSRSSLFRNAGVNAEEPAPTEEERQLSAKLHCFYGISIEPSEAEPEQNLVKPIHSFARSRVYDLRRYTDYNFWGPFLDDGSQGIDWEKVQAIMIVLGYNLQVLHERTDGQFSLVWDKPFSGLAESSFVSRSLQGQIKQPPALIDAEDPYGVTGTWMRVVCFLDYNNLYSFNFEGNPIPADQDREPICTEEAIRLIFLKLRVSKIVAPGEDDAQDMPVVHFTGSSRSMHMSWDPNAHSRIRGKFNAALSSRPIRLTSARHRENHTNGRHSLDNLFHLPRRRAVEKRRCPNWGQTICERRSWDVVRQGLRCARSCRPECILEIE